jgi:glycosyltransferase involved in cell wall biosynthesis
VPRLRRPDARRGFRFAHGRGLFGLPVLTTGYGGQADFCTPDTSWPIDYRFDWAQTHLGTGHSVWLEPDPNHLVRLLRQVYSSPCPSDRLQRARALIEERFTWRQSVSRVQQTVASITAQAPLVRQPLRLAWVSSWNTKCGISSYSSYFLGSLPADDFEVTILSSRTTPPLGPDAGNVRRCWDDYTTPHLRDLERELLFGGYDVVVFQFNFGFFDLTSFANLLVRLYQRQITTVVTFHATAEVDRSGCRLSLADIGNALACADRLLVHGIKDLDYLRGLGLVENAVLFPHGVLERPVREVSEIRQALGIGGPIIATYGFLLPHKGIVETIEALPLIRQTHPGIHLLLVNALYPLPQSEQLRQECARRVQALGQAGHVTPIHEFLSDEEALTLLECADLVLFPYQNTAESSSAAVRAGLSSNRPVACTPMPIFDNVARVTHRLPGFTPLALGRGVSDLLSHPELLASKQEAQRQWVERHSWKGLAARLAGMLRGLHRDRANSAARPLGLVEKRADQRIASGREPMLRVA